METSEINVTRGIGRDPRWISDRSRRRARGGYWRSTPGNRGDHILLCECRMGEKENEESPDHCVVPGQANVYGRTFLASVQRPSAIRFFVNCMLRYAPTASARFRCRRE